MRGFQGDIGGLRQPAQVWRCPPEFQFGYRVVPELEFWGTSPYLSRLSQAAYVALEASHSKACVLADVFHLYKGGSGFEGLRLLSGQAIQVIHLNDYPGNP